MKNNDTNLTPLIAIIGCAGSGKSTVSTAFLIGRKAMALSWLTTWTRLRQIELQGGGKLAMVIHLLVCIGFFISGYH